MADISNNFSTIGAIFVVIAIAAMVLAGASAMDSGEAETRYARSESSVSAILAGIVAVVFLFIGVLFFGAAFNFY